VVVQRWIVPLMVKSLLPCWAATISTSPAVRTGRDTPLAFVVLGFWLSSKSKNVVPLLSTRSKPK